MGQNKSKNKKQKNKPLLQVEPNDERFYVAVQEDGKHVKGYLKYMSGDGKFFVKIMDENKVLGPMGEAQLKPWKQKSIHHGPDQADGELHELQLVNRLVLQYLPDAEMHEAFKWGCSGLRGKCARGWTKTIPAETKKERIGRNRWKCIVKHCDFELCEKCFMGDDEDKEDDRKVVARDAYKVNKQVKKRAPKKRRRLKEAKLSDKPDPHEVYGLPVDYYLAGYGDEDEMISQYFSNKLNVSLNRRRETDRQDKKPGSYCIVVKMFGEKSSDIVWSETKEYFDENPELLKPENKVVVALRTSNEVEVLPEACRELISSVFTLKLESLGNNRLVVLDDVMNLDTAKSMLKQLGF